MMNPVLKVRTVWDTLDRDRINSEFSSKGITRKLVTERSPWRGGLWGRFFLAIKDPLRKVIGKACTSHLF